MTAAMPDVRKSWIIWDIDNCLADDEWRIKYINWRAADPDARYTLYHELAGEDQPCNRNNFDIWRSAGVEAMFFTSRPERFRTATVRWLRKHGFVAQDAQPRLLMRREHDHAHSVAVKEQMLTTCDIPLAQIVYAYDDRADIVAMYRRNGVCAEVYAHHDTCAYTNPATRSKEPVVTESAFPHIDCSPDELGPTRRNKAPVLPKSPDAILTAMAATYKERNAVYGSNYRMVAPMVRTLWPDGVPPDVVASDQWHLFELILVKLSRFAISNLTHQDSIHDAGVYAAMVESLVLEQQQ